MPSLPSSNKSLAYTVSSTPPHLSHTAVTPPGPNELLIRVHAAAINPADIQIWGSPLVGWLTGKEKGIGRDYAGEIVGVGERLRTAWEEGERVFGLFMRPVRILLVRRPVSATRNIWGKLLTVRGVDG
jgi:NADPH:quinone reductase-like Zn-dependent oxidoreductase